MSHLSIALIIVLTIIIISLILIIMHNYQLKTRENSMLSFVKKVALVHNLSFSGQEILRDMVIGLDGPKREVLIVEEKNKNYNSHIIDLAEVNTCKVKKIYAAIDINKYKKDRPEEYLKSITLEFDFKTDRAPVVAYFYRNESNSIYEIRELEARARNWEMMLSKLLQKQTGLALQLQKQVK